MSVFDGLDEVLAEVFADLELGASAQHVSVGKGAGYNTATGRYSGSRADPRDIAPAVDTLTRELVQGVAVRTGDLRLVAPAPQFAAEPKAGDEVLMGGRTWTVLAVKRSQGGDVVMAYELHCRA